MFNRKKLDRERLEIYFVYLLLAYRRLILICGSILLVSGAAVVISSLAAGGILVAVGAFLARALKDPPTGAQGDLSGYRYVMMVPSQNYPF
jgi:hypothetical protein